MSIGAEIHAIKETVVDAEMWLKAGDEKSAENYILALQIFLNASHRQRSMWSARALQKFYLN